MKLKTLTIEETLSQEVISNIKNNQSLVLAFSGGIDSTVLLDILYNILNNKIKQTINNTNQLFKLRAIHVHHGLSRYADHWSYHCAKECEKRYIPFHSIHISCNKNNSNGIEGTARQIRYQSLFNHLEQKEILLTAQHLNDQSETFLLALKRGSGPTGLSGMPQKKIIGDHQLLRPLLHCSKEQIKQYAKNKKLVWIIDDSNTNTRFDRNFLRLHILPKLKNRWPNINKNIARSAQLCAEQETLLDELLKEELKKLSHHDNSLLLEPLINMSIEKKQALLRRWLSSYNIEMPSYKKLYHIWTNVILSKQDATPIMQLNKQFFLRRFQNRLYVLPTTMQTPLNNTIIRWMDIKKTMLLPYGLGILTPTKFSNIINSFNKKKIHARIITSSQNIFSLEHSYHFAITDKILSLSLIRAPHAKEIITIRFNCTLHEKIALLEKSCRKKIKKIWQEFKVPPWVRKNTPLLFYNNKLIAGLGVFITKDGYIQETDTELGIYWIQKTHTQ